MGEIGHNFDAANPGNWIALSRDVREHPIVGAGQPVDPADKERGAWSRMEAWFDLLCLAQWKPSRINNKGQVMTLDAGQLMGALPFLADRWNWTVGTVRWFLNTLEREEMISRAPPKPANHDSQDSRQPTNKCNVITIENYSKYQIMSDALDAYVQQAKRQANDSRTTGEQQANDSNLTRKTPQQGNKEKPTCGGAAPGATLTAGQVADQRFEEFWQAFPGERKRNKGDTRDLFRKIVTGKHAKRKATADEIIAAVKAGHGIDPDYAPMPETWLNGGRWEDAPAGKAAASTVTPWWQKPEKLAEMTAERWRSGIAQYANGIWPVEKLGPPPGDHRCVVPASLIAELRLTDRYTPAGISRDKH
jgi:hypothetical protein